MTHGFMASKLLDTMKDFLCKLGMKLNMCLVKIIIFHYILCNVRLTKIIKDFLKVCKILIIKFIFQCQESAESFCLFFFQDFGLGDQLLFIKFLENSYFQTRYFIF